MNHYTLLLLALAFNSRYISAQLLLGSATLNSSVGRPTAMFHHNMTTATPVASRPQSCGPCYVGGPNVDVYYWPQTSTNTSCLSIIGPTPNPPLAGATISNGVAYWGSTETDPPYSYLMTMLLTAINGITFKMPLQDPWPFTTTAIAPVGYPLMEPIGRRAHAARNIFSLEPRAPFNESRRSTLNNDPLSDGNRTLAESTVVYNGYTMTSPSIYANFYSLTAADSCGPVGGGPNGVITSTLIAFAPGELSTFGAPLNEWLHGMQPGLTSYILPYNFADLPCPPYESMTHQWYKPEPGLPYRPIIAFPSKVLDIDPLWKSCTAAFFTGLDPPTVLHPATALVPLVTPVANANPNPIEAKPSPSSEPLPAKTVQPAAQQIQPARNTVVPDLANDPKTQSDAESKPKAAADPGMFKSDSNSNVPKVGSGATGGAINSPSENEAGNPVAKVTPEIKSAAGVDEHQNAGPDPAIVHSPKEDNDLSSMSDLASDVFGPGTDNVEQPRPIATAGGEPIVAMSQQSSSEEHGTSDPGAKDAKGGETHESPNGNTGDEPHSEKMNPLVNSLVSSEMDDPHSDYAVASQAYTNEDPALTPTPFTTTIGRHVVQALSFPGAILVDGKSITRGQSSKVISGTPVVLQQDGGLVIGTSTIQNLLPTLSPTSNAPSTLNNEILSADHNSADTNSYPASAPQVYRIGSVNITAGGPAITYSGTKIQAFNGGSIVVGGSTYHATSTPTAAARAVGGAHHSKISGSSAGNMSSNRGTYKADNLTGSESGDVLNTSSASVMPFQGSAKKPSVGWSLLCGLVLVGLT